MRLATRPLFTGRLIASSRGSLGFCELYYEVGKATGKNDRKNKRGGEREEAKEKGRRERERDSIPLSRLFDPRALPVSLCRASILGLTLWPTRLPRPPYIPHASLSEVFKSTASRGARAGGNRYPFATDRNIRSVRKEKDSAGGEWFDVDYQREINRGQIRSRRRLLASSARSLAR